MYFRSLTHLDFNEKVRPPKHGFKKHFPSPLFWHSLYFLPWEASLSLPLSQDLEPEMEYLLVTQAPTAEYGCETRRTPESHKPHQEQKRKRYLSMRDISELSAAAEKDGATEQETILILPLWALWLYFVIHYPTSEGDEEWWWWWWWWCGGGQQPCEQSWNMPTCNMELFYFGGKAKQEFFH